jgi:polysaccharide export outer membrane protein
MTPPRIGLLLFATLFVASVWAQSPAPGVPTLPAPAAPSAKDLDYRVGVGDVLEISVYGNEDLSRVATVETSGAIGFPLVGDVPVAGLSVSEIRTKLTSLLARDYLVHPQVEVKVKEYQSQFVIVVGELNNPGRKPLRGHTRLIDLLVDAGGFTPRASGQLIVRRTDGTFDGGATSLKMHLGSSVPSLQDEVNLAVVLKTGDIVTAYPKYYVTVEGEVNRPGRYLLEEDLTVTGAISSAGGLTRFGSNGVKVRRVDPQTGKTQILEVDLKAIRNGKKPDLPLLSNDVISVSRRLL